MSLSLKTTKVNIDDKYNYFKNGITEEDIILARETGLLDPEDDFDKMITKRLFERMSYDNSFKKRKGNILYFLTKFIRMVRMHNIYSFSPISFHPYLKLKLTKY